MVLGPNGAGKSTLLNHCWATAPPPMGKARSWVTISPASSGHPTRLGVLLQNVDEAASGAHRGPTTWHSAPETPATTRRESATMAARSMARLGILHLADKVPHYLSVGRRGRWRWPAPSSPIRSFLVLDEPFEGWIPAPATNWWSCSRPCIARRAHLIVTSHHWSGAGPGGYGVRAADGGKIVAAGTPEEVFPSGSAAGVLIEPAGP